MALLQRTLFGDGQRGPPQPADLVPCDPAIPGRSALPHGSSASQCGGDAGMEVLGWMLDQLVRDYTSSITEAETAVAQTIGNLRLLEEDEGEARHAVDDWAAKAIAASKKADELRGQGNTAEAERFDDLAKVAIRRQVSYEQQSKTLAQQVAQQRELTDQLKSGLNKLRSKREELVQKRNELVSRAKMAKARVQVQHAVNGVSVLDPTSELSRFEERVRREEAFAKGMEEVATSSLEGQFAQLDTDKDEAEVEPRFAELKAAGTTELTPA